MQRTISVVLDPNPALAETVLAFNECCNFFLKLGFKNRTHSKCKLQSLGYYEARERWPRLQSSLVQGARDCAADMLRRERLKRLPVKKATSAVRYNQRTFKAFLESNMLSLSTVRGRIKIPLRIAPYFGRYRKGTVASVRVRDDYGMLRADLVMELPDFPKRDVAEPEVVGDGPWNQQYRRAQHGRLLQLQGGSAYPGLLRIQQAVSPVCRHSFRKAASAPLAWARETVPGGCQPPYREDRGGEGRGCSGLGELGH